MEKAKTDIIVEKTLFQQFCDRNKKNGNLVGLEWHGTTWTFSELERKFADIGTSYNKISEEGKTVTVCSPQLPFAINSFFGLNYAGKQCNVFSLELLILDAIEYLNNTETDTLVILDAWFPLVADKLAGTHVKNIIFTSTADDVSYIDDTLPENVKQALKNKIDIMSSKDIVGLRNVDNEPINFMTAEEFEKTGNYTITRDEPAPYNRNSTSYIFFTGGSTGVPKGIEVTNYGINRQMQMLDQAGFDFVPGDRNGIFVPLNHETGAIFGMVSPWIINKGGVTHILQPFYDKETYADDIINYGLQSCVAAPSHNYTFIDAVDRLDEGAFGEVGFKCAYIGGEAVYEVPAQNIAKALEYLRAKHPFGIIGYGMSELGPVTHVTITVSGLGNKVGRPLPGVKSRIVDDQGKLCEPGQLGHLEILTDAKMKGYHKNPELTHQFFTEDGWAITGDMAQMDENGYYTVWGRGTDYYRTKNGQKVYLFFYENAAFRNPKVSEAEALVIEGVPVVNVVLRSKYKGDEQEVIEDLSILYKILESELGDTPAGIKVRDGFGTNPISTKRDYKILGNERDGYYFIDNETGEYLELYINEDSTITLVPTNEIKVYGKRQDEVTRQLILTK